MHLLRQIYFQPWKLWVLPPLLAPFAYSLLFWVIGLLAIAFGKGTVLLMIALVVHVIATPICLLAHIFIALPMHQILIRQNAGYGTYAFAGYLIGIFGWLIVLFMDGSPNPTAALLFAVPAPLQAVLIRRFRRIH